MAPWELALPQQIQPAAGREGLSGSRRGWLSVGRSGCLQSGQSPVATGSLAGVAGESSALPGCSNLRSRPLQAPQEEENERETRKISLPKRATRA